MKVIYPTKILTIKLGTLPTAAMLLKEIMNVGGIVDDEAKYMMMNKRFTIAKKETKAMLVIVSVNELFGYDTTKEYSFICEYAKRAGLDLCPAEVGPQLRLQYTDQPKNEWVRIAMEPIADSKGRPSLFVVGRFNEPELVSYDHVYPSSYFHPTELFAFVCSKEH